MRQELIALLKFTSWPQQSQNHIVQRFLFGARLVQPVIDHSPGSVDPGDVRRFHGFELAVGKRKTRSAEQFW